MVKKLARSYPGRLILATMLGIIAVGTALLSLPIATVKYIPLLDLFFVSTSATCVCSLLTVPLSDFTTFGQTVILILIQIGGIGLMTLSIIFMSIFLDLGLTTQLMAGRFLEMEGISKAKHILSFIISSTLLIELVGALLVLLSVPEFTFFEAIFHSISSFCNAGFSLQANMLSRFSNNYNMLFVTMALMALGGLGFPVLYDLLTQPFKKRRSQFSLHTKLVIFSAALIITLGTILFLTIQYKSLSLHNVINSLFNAISVRSTGFITMPIADIVTPIYLLIMVMAFIGSAPASTGSGIKTTAIFIAYATAKSVICGEKNIHLFGREVGNAQIQKILSILILSISWISISTFLMLVFEGSDFLRTLFESFSSFCNLGLSIGLTPTLSNLGKIITMISIVMGRIGPITLALVFAAKNEKRAISYPEEKLMLS